MTCYDFVTINRDKRRGPFLIRRFGVPIGHGYSTRKLAERAARESQALVDAWLKRAMDRAGWRT